MLVSADQRVRVLQTCQCGCASSGEEVSKKQISSPLRDQLLSGEKKILINGWHGLQLLGPQTFSKFQVPREHGSAVQVTSRAAVSALGPKDHDHDTVDYLLRAKESLPF